MLSLWLFIFFTPVNNYIQEIKRKNSMLFCWEAWRNRPAIEEKWDAYPSSIASFPMRIFPFKGTCFCLLCSARLAFVFFSGPHTSFSCLRWILKNCCFFSLAFKILKICGFIYYSPLPLFNSEQEELGSAVADWLQSRRAKREFSNSLKSEIFIIIWSESWRINQWEEIFWRMWLP